MGAAEAIRVMRPQELRHRQRERRSLDCEVVGWTGLDSGEEMSVGGTLGLSKSVHSTCLGAAGQSEALAWQVEGTFLTPEQPKLR